MPEDRHGQDFLRVIFSLKQHFFFHVFYGLTKPNAAKSTIWDNFSSLTECCLLQKWKWNRACKGLVEFLDEEGIREEIEANSIKKAIAFQIQKEMTRKHLSKISLAQRMHTSRSAVDRLFNPDNNWLILATLSKAATALEKKLKIDLVEWARETVSLQKNVFQTHCSGDVSGLTAWFIKLPPVLKHHFYPQCVPWFIL